VDAFLDGFTGAGIFGQVRRPGAPDELIDSRSIEEFLQSDDYLQVAAFREARNRVKVDAGRRIEDMFTGNKEGSLWNLTAADGYTRIFQDKVLTCIDCGCTFVSRDIEPPIRCKTCTELDLNKKLEEANDTAPQPRRDVKGETRPQNKSH